MDKEPASGGSVKVSKVRSRSFVTALVFLVIGAVVGGFIAIQITTTQTIARSTNPVQPALELEDTVSDMQERQKNLKESIAVLREDVEVKADELETRRATSKELSGELDEYQTIVGLTSLEGEGVSVVLDDGEYHGLKDRNDFQNDAIIHSTDILDVVNALWTAGAEAITINDERIVGTSSINCIVNTILVNESHVGTPLTIEAIGDSEKLADFISNPQNLVDLHSRKSEYGLVLNAEEKLQVFVPAFTGTYEI
ncbi:DUF881 domain-containing protein [Patescibacteria group bacterium]